jgi:hypothetical protein
VQRLLTSCVYLICAALACESRAPKDAPASGATGKLAGKYKARATNPGGTGSYTADVTIVRNDAYYALTWQVGKERSYRGAGIELPGYLAAGWGIDQYTVFVYELAGGRLNGRWAHQASAGKLSSEVLEGPAGLNGSFTIVDGYDRAAGRRYDGSVSIAPNGAVYRFQYRRSDGVELAGLGLKKGKWLIVGAAPGGAAGVMVYTLSGASLNGQWAQPTSTLLGTEYLSKI